MKIIFLDIDGVMNYSGGKSMTSEEMHFVENEKLILLKQIVDTTGAYLILSSSWRYGWREVDQGRDTSIFAHNYFRLRDKFHEYGMGFFSKTPILKGFTREMEIRYWLSNWENEIIEAFVILDDDEHEFHELRKWLVQTKKDEGLKKEHVVKAIGILGIKSETGEHKLNSEILQRIGINYRKGLTYFGQDEQLYQKYLRQFAHESYTQSAIERLNARDIEGALKEICNLESIIEYICIPSIEEIVHEISKTLQEGETQGVMDGLTFVKLATEEIKHTILEEGNFK